MTTEQKPRVIPATREMLERFTVAELQRYALDLCGAVNMREPKGVYIRQILQTGRATICATLGD